jgi:uncharacterized membrane protein
VLNLLVLGAIMGMTLRHKFMHGLMGMDGPPITRAERRQLRMGRPGALLAASRRLLRTLPKERRRAIHRQLKPARKLLRQHLRQLARARQQLAEALRTGNEARLKEALAALRAAARDVHAATFELSERFIRALTPQERKKLAKILRRKS